MLTKEPLTLAALNERLEGFVDEYNGTEHGSTKETPYARYRRDLACVRAAPEHLLDYFRRREERRVKKDRTVQVKGRVFEVPAKLIDKTIQLHFHAETPDDVEVFYQSLSYGRATPLNLAVNAKGGRDFAPSELPRPKSLPAPPPDAPGPQGGRLFDSVVYGKGGDEP